MTKASDNRNIRVLQFLDAYERQECLWNPALESYKNKLARDEAYMLIIKHLNCPALTINDIKLKVKSIRTTYTKELRLLTRSKDGSKPYIPKLFWFNRANSFLKNVSLSRDKRCISTTKAHSSSLDEYRRNTLEYIPDAAVTNRANIDDVVCDISEGTDISTNTTSNYVYKTNVNNVVIDESAQEEILLQTTNLAESHNTTDDINAATSQLHGASVAALDMKFTATTPPPDLTTTATAATANQCFNGSQFLSNNASDDEYDLFCRSVAVQLRSITDTYSRSVAKLKIQQILFEAETGHYRNSACITMSVGQQAQNL